jgi:hypothetical protein
MEASLDDAARKLQLSLTPILLNQAKSFYIQSFSMNSLKKYQIALPWLCLHLALMA